MGKVKIIDKDRGWKKIAADLRKTANHPYVKVGLVEPASEAVHKGSELTVAEIGVIHEYGSADGSIPPRSFIRTTLISESQKVNSAIESFLKGVILQKYNVETALGRLGLFALSLIKNRITNEHIPPPLAESTIKAKTRDGKTGDVPLVDTAQMLNSIRHHVVMDGRDE